MIVGTGKLQLASGQHPGAMKDAVCSPGGTTIAGVAELERNMIMTALTETGSTYKAARRLKVSQSTIVRKAQRYKIGLVEIAHK